MTVLHEQVVSMYQMLEELLQSKDFEDGIKDVLEVSYPNYLKILENRRKDIERTDHGIVIAGMN